MIKVIKYNKDYINFFFIAAIITNFNIYIFFYSFINYMNILDIKKKKKINIICPIRS